MNARTENTALDDLAEALANLGIDSTRGSDQRDLLVKAGKGSGKALRVEPRFAAAPSIGAIERLIADTKGVDSRRRRHVLVADRVSAAARDLLRESGWGWLDRRGHLRLWAPADGLHIETFVRPLGPGRARDYQEPLATGVGMEVAVSLLLSPGAEVSVRGLARELGRAPSAVSTTLKRLREAALVTERREPLVPELFDEVSGSWAPRRIPLAGNPGPGDPGLLHRLKFNIDDPVSPGWALTDTLAASEFGAPVVVGRGYPPDFYVPSLRVQQDAIAHYGLARSYELRECTISVAPVGAAVGERVLSDDTELPLARPLFIALELARDRARGREILSRWDPPEGFARVW